MLADKVMKRTNKYSLDRSSSSEKDFEEIST